MAELKPDSWVIIKSIAPTDKCYANRAELEGRRFWFVRRNDDGKWLLAYHATQSFDLVLAPESVIVPAQDLLWEDLRWLN